MKITITDDDGFVLEELELNDAENMSRSNTDTVEELSKIVVDIIENHFEVTES